MAFHTNRGSLQADEKYRLAKPEAITRRTKSAKSWDEIGEIVRQNRRDCQPPDCQEENARPLPATYGRALSSSICRNR